MIYLILSILFSVALLVNFRIFPKFGINTLQTIIFNYPVCFITGYLLLDKTETFQIHWDKDWTYYCFLLGLGFIITFILSGFSTQKIGITLTSLANNMSLIIPVLFSLFVFRTQVDYPTLQYIGIALGIISIGIATYKADNQKVDASFLQSGGLALSVFLMYGITNTAINYIQINIIKDGAGVIPVMLTMILGAIISGAILLVYRIIQHQEKIELKNAVAALTLGIPNFLSFYFLLQALAYFGSSGAVVYPLYNMGVILVSALVSRIIFKEKLSKTNQLGLALAVMAIVFISWNALFV